MICRFLNFGAIVVALFFCVAINAPGQGEAMDAMAAAKYPNAAEKPTPHMADGKPDLNGVWHHYFLQGDYEPAKPGESSSFLSVINHVMASAKDVSDASNMPVYRPEFAAQVQDLNEHQEKIDPTLTCAAPGVPRLGPPHQIVQTPGQVVFLYTDLTGEFFRVVPMDGRPHRTDQEPSANGDSVGHWEGDTLVVDTTNFTDDTWLADNGLLHSDKLHVTERLERKGDTINYQVTVDDPVVLAKPWTMDPRTLILQKDVLEQAPPCVDMDSEHFTNLSHHDNNR